MTLSKFINHCAIKTPYPGFLLLAMSILITGGCRDNGPLSDAFGNFEATEVIVSAQASGQLLRFTADEGRPLSSGAEVGLVDTTQLALKRRQLMASRLAVRSKTTGIQRQIEVVEAQKKVATTEKNRIEQLLEDQAATQKQFDDINGQLEIFDRQIAALASQFATVQNEIEALDAQLAQVDDLLRQSHVVSPIDGVVIASYAEAGELTGPGKPLFKIAALDTLDLRAYVSGAQLPDLRLGQNVEVIVDKNAEENQSMSGVITWIASQAEFTPKLIQTKEERVNLVYAIKVRVANPDGILKIGMPGEVVF